MENTPELRERVVEALRSLDLTPSDCISDDGSFGRLQIVLGVKSDPEAFSERDAAVIEALNTIQDELNEIDGWNDEDGGDDDTYGESLGG